MPRSSKRPNAPVLPSPTSLLRATPSAASSPFPFASSSSSSSSASPFTYSSSPNSYLRHRSASPTRVYFAGSSPPPRASSVRFALDRSITSVRSLGPIDRLSPPSASASIPAPAAPAPPRRTCMCSPTTHPGSFRCSLHKGLRFPPHHHAAAPPPSYRLSARRSAMTNSLVRIGTVEGDLVKRALAALIRPSSHQQRRRADFCPRPSRLSVMSKAGDL